MVELILIGLLIAFGIYDNINTERNSKFNLGENAVHFPDKNILLQYSDIISIERDISSKEGRTMYFAYIITYYDEHGKIDSFRFYKGLTDSAKWNRLKSNVVDANPLVKINESIL